MSKIDINKVENSTVNGYEGEKESLIDDIKKANFFVEYFKKKSDSKYQEISQLYNQLTNEVNLAVLDNKIETRKDLNDLKDDINKKSEIEKINEIINNIEKLLNNNLTNPDILSRLDSSKLDNNEKQKLFFEIKENPISISYIKDENIINEFFQFYNENDLTQYYKCLSSYLQETPGVIKNYIKYTNQINFNLIPDSYFKHKIEGVNNIENITNEIINGNPSKLEMRIRGILSRLIGSNENLRECLNVLLQDEKTKNLISSNIPKELLDNEIIIKYLYTNGVDINNEIGKDSTNGFDKLSQQILDLNLYDKNYDTDINNLINELDKIIIKKGVQNMELFKKIIQKIPGKIENFSSINYNKELALKVINIDPSIFMKLSNKLRSDKDIIKNTIKNPDYYGYAYFINIDSTEVLIDSYKLLKNMGVDDVTIFNFPNFLNGVKQYAQDGIILSYEYKYKLSNDKSDLDFLNSIKEIKNNEEKERNSFGEVLKGVELILNNDNKEIYKKLILDNLKDENKTNEFINILYKNKDFSIQNYKDNYRELLKLCSGDETILKNIFNGLVDKQSELYNNPEQLKKVVNDLVEKSEFDLEKIKKILGENQELSKYVKINNKDTLDIDNELLINDFKEHYKKLKEENVATNKEFAIESYLQKLGLGDNLGLEDGKLRKILGGILQFDYKKIEVKTISENKEIAWEYASGKISKEEYDKLFQEKYNEKLEKNGLEYNKNSFISNEEINSNNYKIETNQYSYYPNSGIIELNTPNGKQNLELSPIEIDLANNKETLKNIVDFYKTLNELGLNDLWKYRENIFTAIGNKIGIGFDIGTNYLNENQVKIFLNSILSSVGEEKIDPTKSIDEFKNIFSQKNDRQIISNGYSDNVMKKGGSKISELFLQKYILKLHFDIEGLSENI